MAKKELQPSLANRRVTFLMRRTRRKCAGHISGNVEAGEKVSVVVAWTTTIDLKYRTKHADQKLGQGQTRQLGLITAD